MKKIFRLFLILTVLSGVVFTTSCEKEEAPVGHTHDYAIKVVAPKCEDDGYTEYVCRDCGYEYHDTIVPAKGHDFDFYLSESLNLETEVGEDVYMCSDCEKKEYTLVSHVNTKDKGVKDFYLGTNKYNVSTTDGYTNSYFQLTVSDIDIHDTGSLYYTFNADDGLFYHRAFRLDFSGNGQAVTYAYENGGYPSSVINMATCKMDAKNKEITFKFEYDKHNIKKSEAVGNHGKC